MRDEGERFDASDRASVVEHEAGLEADHVEAHLGDGETLPGDKDVHSGDKEAHFGDKDVHSGDKEAHFGDGDVHSGDKEAHFGDGDVHSGDKEAHFGDGDVHSGDGEKAYSGDGEAHLGDDAAAVRDSLPVDLDASGYVGPYLFPNNNRRRIPGVLYLVLGAFSVLMVLVLGSEAVLVNGGFAVGGVVLTLFGVYCLLAGWNLDVDEHGALVAAAREVGFPVGHASAQLAWRGLSSRPTWRILLYSNESPPDKRGLVLVDGVDGEILGQMVEQNPEDWSGLSN